MLFSEFPFIFKRQLAYKGREKIRYITYLCREKYFLTMRKTINCFIPYRESTAAEQTIHALKESSIVNKIYLLNIEPNKTLSTPNPIVATVVGRHGSTPRGGSKMLVLPMALLWQRGRRHHEVSHPTGLRRSTWSQGLPSPGWPPRREPAVPRAEYGH